MTDLRNTFSYEWFRTKTRFDTEAKGNSKLAYSDWNLLMRLAHFSSEFQLVNGILTSAMIGRMGYHIQCILSVPVDEFARAQKHNIG